VTAKRFVTPNRILAVVLVVAAGLAAALIVVSVTGAKSDATVPTAVQGGAATDALLKGITQHGNVLGNPDAPVTIVEYADFQCPYCARWAVETFPALVREYVRPGKVKIVFGGVAFVGPDSVPALQTAVAAGEQNRLWNVAELIYRNQGMENTGWVTDDLMRSIGEAVPGLDASRMMADRSSPFVATGMSETQGAAQLAGVSSTPTFELGRSSGSTSQLQEGALPIQDFRRALHSLLAQR
jgi:protein-disulfide isomerase